jgi:hypothetical protein
MFLSWTALNEQFRRLPKLTQDVAITWGQPRDVVASIWPSPVVTAQLRAGDNRATIAVVPRKILPEGRGRDDERKDEC